MYWSVEPASPMGLVQQYQFCKSDPPAAKQCSELSSMHDVFRLARKWWLGTETYDYFYWIFYLVVTQTIASRVQALGPAVLESPSHLQGGILGPLARNQWQIDVEKWINISLASIQQSCVELASGPSDPRMDNFITRPESNIQKRMCRNQVSQPILHQ